MYKMCYFVPETHVETTKQAMFEVRDALVALKRAHPYEEPAYEIYRLADF